MSLFAKYQADSAPPALQHPRWRALTETIGATKDATATAAKDAAKCMLVVQCPDDALALHAAERALERYPTETADDHRARMAAVWTALGYGTATVHSAIDAAPSWWVGSWPPASEGERPSRWVGSWPVPAGSSGRDQWPSRFWVDLAGTLWAAESWGGGYPWGVDTGITWGSTAPRAAVALVKRVIRRWRPAHCVCIGVFVERTDTQRIFWPTWPYEE
jgi:hypothetical protein